VARGCIGWGDVGIVLVEALLTPHVQDVEGARPIYDGYEYCNRPQPWACLQIDVLRPIPDQMRRVRWSFSDKL
jgi:hypothetical protein